MGLDPRPSLHSVLRRAQQVIAAHHVATAGGVEVIWQHLAESAVQLADRVDETRDYLPDTRLLVVVCVAGALQTRPNVTVVELPSKHFALLHPSRAARYRVLKGGRGAAKSHSIARAVLARAVSLPITIGCFREVQNSIRDSVHKLLCDTINKLGLARHFDVGVQYIRSHAGAQFLFEGLRGNVNGIRSLEGLDVAWVEEAAKVSEQSWEVLIPTVRAAGSEIVVNYNPEAATDPTHVRLAVNTPPLALIDHFTFADNPWFPPELEAERLYLQRVDDDAFRHVWLGECRTHSAAQVLEGKVSVEEFSPQPNWDGPYQGADWGFSQDPTALVRCWVYERTLYVSHEAWGLGVDIDKTPALFNRVPDAANYVTRADCARPETISYMRAHGYANVTACEKWAGSVEDGIAHLRSYERIVIHPRCEHTLEEGRLYSYKVDRLSGDVLPDVVDKHNHCMDALRYALAPLIQSRGAAALMSFYTADEAKRKADAATARDGDEHHRVDRAVLGLVQARVAPMLERAKKEQANVKDL